ncbi:hypothetical protein CYPRO_1094 [Cyclonatronum proteinivorum]|uniref:Uncharacterized protein n=1 Tax=Cyclonatronum proteinivorum TaxID=1457365 RepID=A0A345UIQ7_9BACT|nr:hypothetical protein CYPRO_1094 [Cyclonatronum proteinivorum]
MKPPPFTTFQIRLTRPYHTLSKTPTGNRLPRHFPLLPATS